MKKAFQKPISSIIFMAIIIGLGLVSCKPTLNNGEKSTATQIETSTHTISPTFTSTITPTRTVTKTKFPTSTITPTSTLIPGSFNSPLRIGDTTILDVIPAEYRKDKERSFKEYQLTLIEIKIGEEAEILAKNQLGWSYYEEPLEAQEYIAVYVKYFVTSEQLEFDLINIYPCWDLYLRYFDDGSDTQCVNIIQNFGEGYSPFQTEGWVFFLIKGGSKPYLYFQPLVNFTESYISTNLGVYFQLFD